MATLVISRRSTRSSLACALIAAACALGLMARPAAPHHGAGTGRAGVASIPLAARGPISAALGRGEPAYRLRGLRAGNPAQRLRVRFSRRGVEVVSGGARFGLMAAAFGRSGAMAPVAPAVPGVSANRVTYAHGSMSEWYANGPLGIEQGFDVATRPHGAGALTISLALSGGLNARLAHGSVLLSGRGVSLRYGGLVAADTRGRTLPARLAVVRGHILIRVDDRRARYPLHIDPFVEQAKLEAVGDSDPFAVSVAVSGNTVVVGAVGANSLQGAAYVFVKPPGGWADVVPTAQAAKLTASDGAPGDELGTSVAIDGGTIIAGASERKLGTNDRQGAAYLFGEPPGGWADATETAELTAGDGEADDALGQSVAISGATAVAGAPGHAPLGAGHHGAAYVFVKPRRGWRSFVNEHCCQQTAELTSSDGPAGNLLGSSVAISGDTIVAGAPTLSGAAPGAAYVFVRPATGWADALQDAKLTAGDGVPGDYLGTSVAIDGGTIVAGAPHHFAGDSDFLGAVYVYVRPAGGWTGGVESAEAAVDRGQPVHELGASVAISGNRVVAGAPGLPTAGAAYEFVMPSGGWASTPHICCPAARFTASDPSAQLVFGDEVAVSGDTIVAGTKGQAEYVFGPTPSVSISTPADGAVYTQGQVVDAAFACADEPGGPGPPPSCLAPVAGGAPIDTQTPGPHTFTVTATNNAGATVSRTTSYSVVASTHTTPTPPGTTTTPTLALLAPVISAARETHKTWREGTALAHISAHRKKKPPVGTTFSFSLNEPASVALSFSRATGGRKAHGRCVAATAKNRHASRCTRTVAEGTLTLTGHQGTNKIGFAGRVSKTKKLKRGRHAVTIAATNAQHQRSAPQSLTFTIVA